VSGDHLFARSDPEDIRECNSCEIKEIADWLGAKYSEDQEKSRVIIDKDLDRRLTIVVLKVLPNMLQIFAARPGATSDILITLSNVNHFTFQRLELDFGDSKEEIRQVIFRNAKGVQIIIDDSGGIALSG